MRKFAHLGCLTTEPKPGEMWIEGLGVWVTNADDDPNLIEWVRLTPDSAFAGTPVADGPHIAWMVEDLDAALVGKDVVFAPYRLNESIRIAYFREQGAIMEYMEVK